MKASLIIVTLCQLALLAAAAPAPEPAAAALVSREALPQPFVFDLLDLTKKGYSKCGETKCDVEDEKEEEEPEKKKKKKHRKGDKCSKDWVSPTPFYLPFPFLPVVFGVAM
jgi:hypothetical protein